MKSGANRTDVNKIIKMAGENYSAQEISQKLQVPLTTVESFMPKAKAKPTRAKKTAKSNPDEDALIFSD